MKAANIRIVAPLMASMLLLSSVVEAADVRWEDLPKKLGRSKVRSDGRGDPVYRVVTKDGGIAVGYELILSPDGIQLASSRSRIPREDVTEIQIHRDGILLDALLAPNNKLFGEEHLLLLFNPWSLALLPVFTGTFCLSALVVLPVQAVKRLLPDKVIRMKRS